MIIEFLGPPCAGKTTLAKALTMALRAHGHDVRLVSSWRPSEQRDGPASVGRHGDAARRLARAITEMGHLIRNRSVQADHTDMTKTLLTLLPPRQALWKLRMYQYIARLANNWSGVSNDPRITVFDQAFIQAVYSLAVLAGRADREIIERAMTLIPIPDLLVRVTVAGDVLADRLAQRHNSHGRLERLLEVSPSVNLASAALFDTLDAVLCRLGVPVVEIESGVDVRFDAVFRALAVKVPTANPHEPQLVAG